MNPAALHLATGGAERMGLYKMGGFFKKKGQGKAPINKRIIWGEPLEKMRRGCIMEIAHFFHGGGDGEGLRDRLLYWF